MRYAKDIALFRFYMILLDLNLAPSTVDDVWGSDVTFKDIEHFVRWASQVIYEA